MSTILEEKQEKQTKELLKPKVDIVFHALFREENKKSIAFCLHLTENYYFCPRIKNQSKKDRFE